MPSINKEFALKLINDEKQRGKNTKSKNNISILNDNRFKELFENPEFQIDKNSEEYK